MNRKITIAIAGLGSRGKDAYAPAIARMSDRAEIVAVADIDFAKVQKAAQIYHVPEERCFNSAESLLAENRLADVLVLATQDRQHVQQAIPALEKGYDLLLEKPISPNIEECKQLLEVSKRTGRKVVVCHVLRYTPFFEKAKQILDSGVIGDIVSIMAIENVGYWHQAHSFVRGNWSNSSTTSPMILQKCCHDMDLYMAGMFQKRSWETCIIRTCRTPQSAGRSLPCSFASSVLLYRNLLPQNRWLLRPIMYGSIFMRRNGKPSCPLLIF